MTIRIALHHETHYRYERIVSLSPQTVRLRPAPHCRTPVRSYSLAIEPTEHFINWQQDPFGNFLARLVFREPTSFFRVTVDLIVDMVAINPFDFFVEPSAQEFPFAYEPALKRDLRPFLETESAGPQLTNYLRRIDRSRQESIAFLVDVNGMLQSDIKYLVRLEPGVQSCEETLTLGYGSCRDTAWLLVQLLRQAGLAARFVSGYLVQLASDAPPVDGPAGPSSDFTDLHAWAEVYIPGGGWIGLDPTSGLLAGEGHIPLAVTPDPLTAAPVTGGVEPVDVGFGFDMNVTRIHETPRVTKPYSDDQWCAINQLGRHVDEQLSRSDVRLTIGGKPTFISIDDMESDKWNTAAVGVSKRRKSIELAIRLRDRFAPGGLLHTEQGKWYPGESLPRWADSCIWRVDSEPVWNDATLLADPSSRGVVDESCAQEFIQTCAENFGVHKDWIRAAWEDPWHAIAAEHRLPLDVNLENLDTDSLEDRIRLAQILERGLRTPRGYVLPLTRAWWQADAPWVSGPWRTRSAKLFLIPGDSVIGLRLPLGSLPAGTQTGPFRVQPADPTAPRSSFPKWDRLRQRAHDRKAPETAVAPPNFSQCEKSARRDAQPEEQSVDTSPAIPTALCVEVRNGHLHVFLPPQNSADDFLDLTATIEATAAQLAVPVVMEGYPPPPDHRLNLIKVTPDPGVIEVNVQPGSSWDELVDITEGLYEEAKQTRLGTEKFELDGRHTGTGGGNYVVLGAPTPLDSPFLRRPDLLRSLLTCWNNHPSLSWLFAGMFVGPTSQAPRVDEGRPDAVFELQIAFEQIPQAGDVPPWLVDRLFRNLLVDVTGNTHRAEFCIDKLYSPDNVTGRLGLVELRSFEMPPHARMSLVQQLLVRTLVARFWESPCMEPLIAWGTALHDRWMLPWFLEQDLRSVLGDLKSAGFDFDPAWFAPHLVFRCPLIGSVQHDDVHVELRQAIEPWYVLGEKSAGGATVRYVDSSIERLQVLARGVSDRHAVTCNGRPVPLTSTAQAGTVVGSVRYRARQPPHCLHPTIGVHTPLVFDIVDRWQSRSIGGATYYADHAGGLNPGVCPVNVREADSRRATRFSPNGHTGGLTTVYDEPLNPDCPLTLDLRRSGVL